MSLFSLLMEVALGRQPADLVIQGGTLVNTATAELLPGWGVAVKAGRIAAIGAVSRCIGPETKVVDAAGLFVAPGFVDPHYHIESSRLTPARHAEVTVPYGLTTLIEDPHEACAVLGSRGMQFFLDAASPLPQRLLCTVSSATPPTGFETAAGYIGPEEMMNALGQEGIIGLGELMDPPRLFGHDKRLWGMIEVTRASGRRMEGHGGFLPPEVDAFAAIGVGSTHSPRSAAEALEMLRRGLYLQLQVDRAEEIIPTLLDLDIDWSQIGLAVDDRAADRLLEVGPINFEVRRCIELGVPAPRAYQMASFSNARYWRMDGDLGVLAPGRIADILLISDLNAVAVERVYFEGKLVAQSGRMLEPLQGTLPDYAYGTVHLPRPLKAEDFAIPYTGSGSSARVFVLKPGYYGRELDQLSATVPVVGGALAADPAQGVTKAVVIDRHSGNAGMGKGFWRLGLKRGAVAFTVLHDSHNLCVVGVNDADMALAANRAAELGGGIVVAADGQIVSELALPVLGLMSDHDLTEIAAQQRALDAAGRDLGLDTSLLGQHPVDRLTFLFLTCHPRKYQLTDQGLFDVLTGNPIPLVLEEAQA